MKVDVSLYLKETVKETFYFHPNPGNAGDSLINVGCYDCFKKASLDYLEFSDGLTCNPEDYRDKIVILGGGGGFIPAWSFTKNFVERFHKVCKLLIIMPHTVSGNESLLKCLGNNVVIFARERVTFNYLTEVLTGGAKVMYADDMAFSVNLENINNIIKPKLSFKHEIKNFLNTFRSTFFRLISGGNLYAFRNDAEKTEIKIPKWNYDVSIAYAFGTENEDLNRYSAYKLLECINKSNRIYTNRLHGAISSALLGKEVNFYSNNYFKCRAVYEASLKDTFPKVIWMK
ncbi:polysaccharide pyruvyl transferase family protein [Escherichia coli]